MIKLPIDYVDYNGEKQTEDFYFNLTDAELVEMETSVDGGLSTYIKRIAEAQTNGEIVKVFKKLILMSYGIKTPDGKRFMKSEALREEFEQSPAYSVLFMKLATNEKEATAFINGIVPQHETNSLAAQ